MNLRMILIVTLLFLIVMGLFSYGYIIKSIHGASVASADAASAGKKIVSSNAAIVYGHIALQLVQFIVSGLATYMK